MRTSSKAVQDATGTKDPIEAMGKLREMKVSTRDGIALIVGHCTDSSVCRTRAKQLLPITYRQLSEGAVAPLYIQLESRNTNEF